MTKTKIEIDRIFTNFLRTNLTDINSSRSGQWIYPDFPRVKDLGDTSFPRVGITIINEESNPMGVYDDNQLYNVTVQFDVVTKKDLVNTLTVTSESSGSMSATINSDRLSMNYLPYTITNIKHNTTAFSTTSIVATDSIFTSPPLLGSGTVEVSFSTGNMNFDSTDITSYDGQDIETSYTVKLEGKRAVQHIARDIIKQIRTKWRTDTTFGNMFDPILINNTPMPLDENLGIFRQTVEYKIKKFNVGEGL